MHLKEPVTGWEYLQMIIYKLQQHVSCPYVIYPDRVFLISLFNVNP